MTGELVVKIEVAAVRRNSNSNKDHKLLDMKACLQTSAAKMRTALSSSITQQVVVLY